MKKIILIIPILLLFCGCNDYKELNNIAIVSGMSIDIKDDKYEVNILVANSKTTEESAKEGTAGNAVYNGKGISISDALKKIDNILPKQLYLGHLGVVVISEDVAERGIDDITDYFFRNPETTKRFYLIMTRDNQKAGDVLKILSPLESFPFQNIRLNIENSSSTGSLSDNLTYSEFIEMYLKKGINPYIPTIKIYGNVKKGSSTKALESTNIKSYVGTKGLALFTDTKFVGYASEDESRGINVVIGNASDMLIKNKYYDGYINTAISNLKTTKKVKFKNNKPIFYVNVKASGDIVEVDSKMNLYDEQNLKELQYKIEKRIKELCLKGIDKAKDIESDVFGFGNMVYKKNPKYFKSIKDWNKYFKDVDIKVYVSVEIKNKGAIKQSIKGAKYESME